MSPEMVFFHQGISTDTRSVLQKPGFVKTLQNLLLEVEGSQSLRPFFTAYNSTAIDSVHSMKYWRGLLLVGDGTNLHGSLTGTFTSLGASFSGERWFFKPYKDFIGASDGTSFLLVDVDMNSYPAQVENPATAPTGTKGSAGNPNGKYTLYVSFFVTWPNGHTYETGLSPISSTVDVSGVSGSKIAWTNIPKSTYAAVYGTAPTIYRNLYRGPGTGGTLTEIYYVDTLTNNTATTYTDDISDADLQASYVATNGLYTPPITPKLFEWHYGRLFMVDPTDTWRFYHTEVAEGNTAEANASLMPIAMDELGWDDIRVAGFDEVDPQAVVSWGYYLYIALKQTWIRKQGDDPTNWAFRKTFSRQGIIAPHTVDTSSMGIFGVCAAENDEVGVALFNGQYSEIITSPRLDKLLKDDLDITKIQDCFGRVGGKYYFLLYTSVDGTDKILAIDLRRHPDDRVAYWTDLYGKSVEVDRQGSSIFFGGSDGYVRIKGDAEDIDVIVETHDMMGGDPKVCDDIKTWKEIKYAIDSAGADVTLQIYIDDILMKWPDGTTEKIITGTSDAIQYLRNLPTNWKGYKIRLLLTGTALSTFILYSPWKLDFDLTS